MGDYEDVYNDVNPYRICLAILREADELGISGNAIGTDSVGLEALFHVGLTGPIKRQAAFLHNLENLSLCGGVQSRARVTVLNVAGEVKVSA